MNKKGKFLGLVSDFIGWFILFLVGATFFILFSFSSGKIVVDIHGEKFAAEDTMLTILRTPVNNYNVADGIVMLANGQTDTATIETIDKILNSIYGQANKVCWGLWNADILLHAVDCKGEKEEIFEGSATIPSPNPIDIRLAVLGYRE